MADIWVVLGIAVAIIVAIAVCIASAAVRHQRSKDAQTYQYLQNQFSEVVRKNEGLAQQLVDLRHDDDTLRGELRALREQKVELTQRVETQQTELNKFLQGDAVFTQDDIDAARKKSTTAQKAVLKGFEFENIVPFVADIPGHRKDLVYLGNPIDFISFVGKYDKKIREIVFIEVKSGDAKLTTRERHIKQCVEAGRVRFMVIRESDIVKGNTVS